MKKFALCISLSLLVVSLLFCTTSFAKPDNEMRESPENISHDEAINETPNFEERPHRQEYFDHGRVNEDYSSTIHSDTPCTWELVDGELPEGLELEGLDSQEPTLKGRPTETGEYNFTLERRDAETNEVEERNFNVKIVDRNEDIPERAEENSNNSKNVEEAHITLDTNHNVNIGGGCNAGFGNSFDS